MYLQNGTNREKQNSSQKSIVLEVNVIHHKEASITQQ